MTHVSRGCAFLVARGRRTVYRVALAPGFLVNVDLQHLLAQKTGTTAERARLVEAGDAGTDLRCGYGLHGGSSCPGLGSRPERSQPERTGREDRRSKFYETSDNLL